MRKVLNLTYAWLVDLLGGTDEWKHNYEPIFVEHEHPDFDYVDAPATGPGGLVFGGI